MCSICPETKPRIGQPYEVHGKNPWANPLVSPNNHHSKMRGTIKKHASAVNKKGWHGFWKAVQQPLPQNDQRAIDNLVGIVEWRFKKPSQGHPPFENARLKFADLSTGNRQKFTRAVDFVANNRLFPAAQQGGGPAGGGGRGPPGGGGAGPTAGGGGGTAGGLGEVPPEGVGEALRQGVEEAPPEWVGEALPQSLWEGLGPGGI